MRNENGESRGFGFVSFQTPDQGMFTPRSREQYPTHPFSPAAMAMNAMNGAQLGTKQVVVRLHEPKQLRQEKLAQRFGHNGPRNSSGATSPTASEAGESYVGWPSPRHQALNLGSPVGSHFERPERGRRGSGSYYTVRVSYLARILIFLTCDIGCVQWYTQFAHALRRSRCAFSRCAQRGSHW
jgi:polyadenylate-binding protein